MGWRELDSDRLWRRETVLVVTNRSDATCDPVIEELTRRGAEVVRFDTADFPTASRLAATLTGRGRAGRLAVGSRVVDLEAVRSVWWRRPGEFRTPRFWPADARAFAAPEARSGLLGVLSPLPVRWVNHPSRNAAANYKPHQLAAASRCGLDTPRTVVDDGPQLQGGLRRSDPALPLHTDLDQPVHLVPPSGSRGPEPTRAAVPETGSGTVPGGPGPREPRPGQPPVPNSPALTAAMKADHSRPENAQAGPAGRLLSRTMTASAAAATSTQFVSAPLNEDLHQSTGNMEASSIWGIDARLLLIALPQSGLSLGVIRPAAGIPL